MTKFATRIKTFSSIFSRIILTELPPKWAKSLKKLIRKQLKGDFQQQVSAAMNIEASIIELSFESVRIHRILYIKG